jgi:hypothetical protein
VTSPREPSPGKKAIDYAEEELGVHRVHETALTARANLDRILTSLSEARDARRDLESRIQDREMEVSSDERGKHPEMSDAAMGRHLKVVYNQDDNLRELREQLNKVIGDIEGFDYDRAIEESDIKIAVGRMNELGGYFAYLAAIKLSNQAKSANTANTEKQ